MNMNRIAALGLAAITALLAVPAPAHSDTLPQCVAITDLNCQGTFVNTTFTDWPIRNLPGVGQPITYYRQVVNGVTTERDVWPFRNPTLGSAWALQERRYDPTMFPAGYGDLLDTTKADSLVAANATIADLTRTVQAQSSTITRLQARIARLEQRIARLQARLSR